MFIHRYKIVQNIPQMLRNFSCSKKLLSEELNVHRDSKDNHALTPFEFTEANMTRLCAIIQNYPEGCQRSALSAAIDLVQRQIGWIPISAMHKVAEILSIPRMRVYEWATFYTMNKSGPYLKNYLQWGVLANYSTKSQLPISIIAPHVINSPFTLIISMNGSRTVRFTRNFIPRTTKLWNELLPSVFPSNYDLVGFKRRYRGKFNVKVCVTTPCMLRGSDIILQAVEEATCCCAGGLSADGMFGVDTVQCQGACANAPVMAVDDDYYEDLTVCDVYNIIQILKCGGIPPWGPQSGRFAAEPITGLTSLCECPPPPGFGIQPELCQASPPKPSK